MEGRNRSVSPETERVTKRNNPRTGRARRNPPINTTHADNSVGKEGEKESTTDEQNLEEGEIPAEGLSTGDVVGDSLAGTSVGQDSVAGNGCSDQAVGTEPQDSVLSGHQETQMLRAGTKAATSVNNAMRGSVIPLGTADQSEHEAPFFLVDRRKCGRKVAKFL